MADKSMIITTVHKISAHWTLASTQNLNSALKAIAKSRYITTVHKISAHLTLAWTQNLNSALKRSATSRYNTKVQQIYLISARLTLLLSGFRLCIFLKPSKAKFSKSSLIQSNLLYFLWKYNQSDKCFVWCCHRSLRKERTNDISWTIVGLHVNQVLILNTTAPKTFIKPKLVASHAADIQSPWKSFWDSLETPTSDQLGPLQMHSNGFFLP